MRTGYVALVAAIALAMLAGPAVAQRGGLETPPSAGGALVMPQDKEGQQPARRGKGPRMENWQDKDIRELVETVMMVRLSKELELSDEETVVMVRRLSEAKERGAELARERSRILGALKSAVKQDASDEDIEKRLDELIAVDGKIQSLRLDAFREAAEGLSVKQRARLYVFVQEFEENLRRMIAHARETKGMPEGTPMGRQREMMMQRRQMVPPQVPGVGGLRRSSPPNGPGGPQAPSSPSEEDAPPAQTPEN